MVNRQLLIEENLELSVTMSGEGMEDTIGKIFKVLRKEVYEKIGRPIIQMETKEVYFDKIDCVEKTERYMFLFMPRVKKYYTVTARIYVAVKYLDLEKEEK